MKKGRSMLKSLELKNEVKELRDKINGLIEQKAEVPQELQAELSDKLEQYAAQVKEESENKVIKGEDTMDRKVFNKALKDFLVGADSEEKREFFDAAKGNNGAVTADGGALIPEELLDLKENGVLNNDLRALATVVPVSSRSGSIPIVDYSQKLELVNFDENNELTEKKAVFAAAKYTLASKGVFVSVSREMLMDSRTDVPSIIGNIFNTTYKKDVNKSILTAATKGATSKNVTAIASKAGLDAIKQAIITLPLDAGANATVVMNQSTFAALAVVVDKQDRYLLVRDAGNATIRGIEGRPVVVVADDELATNTVLVGDFRAIYHIAHPEIEVMADESAGFTRNSLLVRAVCRFEDINTYDKAFVTIKQGA